MTRQPAGARHLRLLAAVVVAATNLRPALASVPPLLTTIERDLHLSGAAAGALITVPVICMGAFAPGSARVAHRLGPERTVRLALVLVFVGVLARLAGGNLTVLYGSTLIVGVGVALLGTLMPALAKSLFPDRGPQTTALYLSGLVGGAMLASGLSVPLLHLTGSWQRSLASWSLLALAALILWPVPRREADEGPAQVTSLRPWRSTLAWRITMFGATLSLVYYSTLTWLAPTFESHGMSPARGGVMLLLFNGVQVATALIVPTWSDRTGHRRRWLLGMTALSALGLCVLALTPMGSPVVLSLVLGIAQGSVFALLLTLLVQVTHDPAATGRLSGMVFLVGYLTAAIGPTLLGAVRDATHGYRAGIAILIGVCAIQAVAASLIADDAVLTITASSASR